ncbi:TetR/AcrR family transcriptional regulator [Amycolatopsis acidiphila]|uniref:Helix-turn-helix transcriptional regulator n=1 Tax=Amycolatopsis acidiphila TaxID=715473 RepID=A0A557ZXU6_9PSEU|nr:TetR/AcrR family transcriptional regulator [Amycolatopsis acidiphila]TVT16827.1 helix-turn-helix transcriptional regulator [Amycolatopsis acidiphila]UIJ63029.1 TetR/AcrR family transcriptional regulator [Amycolatopsis acidiphila]GHG65735.1 TetR family transcriptional regulator [Amycolatopsis acidiphila]
MGRTRGFDVGEALDAALRTFWQQGFDATSMQDLCQAMQVRPGSVYAAFGAKRELFAAALRRYAETVTAEAVGRITAAPTGMQGLRDYFAHLIDAMVDGDRRWGCLITNSVVEFATRDPDLAGLMSLHLANLRAAFAAALTRARAEGELRPGAGPESAELLVAVVQGMNVLAKSRPGRAALESVAASALAGLVP